MSRTWAMPSPDTFSIKPIAEFIKRWTPAHGISVDPFARNSKLATFTNDLNPNTTAMFNMEAEKFLESLKDRHFFGLMLFDPPYSPRQISECYKDIGKQVGMEATQNAALYKRCRDAAMPVLQSDAIVLSFGWNSAGMGKGRGFQIQELLLVAHGGAHNDTICLAEKRIWNSPQNKVDTDK